MQIAKDSLVETLPQKLLVTVHLSQRACGVHTCPRTLPEPALLLTLHADNPYTPWIRTLIESPRNVLPRYDQQHFDAAYTLALFDGPCIQSMPKSPSLFWRDVPKVGDIALIKDFAIMTASISLVLIKRENDPLLDKRQLRVVGRVESDFSSVTVEQCCELRGWKQLALSRVTQCFVREI